MDIETRELIVNAIPSWLEDWGQSDILNCIPFLINLIQDELSLPLEDILDSGDIWVGVDLLLKEPNEEKILEKCYRHLGSFEYIQDFIDHNLEDIDSYHLELIRDLLFQMGENIYQVLSGGFTYLGNDEETVYGYLFDEMVSELENDPICKLMIQYISDGEVVKFINYHGLDNDLIVVKIGNTCYYFEQ